MNETLQKFYVTKYALTSGIMQVKGRQSTSCPEMLVVNMGNNRMDYFHGKAWHTTREAAVARAKLKSLEKQIKKITALKF